jgi:hypothetical protein
VRGDCSFCWYWWNCWPSLFKLSIDNYWHVRLNRCTKYDINIHCNLFSECNCNPAGAKEVPGYPLGGCGQVPVGQLCECKDNVMGHICDQCKPGYYGLDRNNPLGCRRKIIYCINKHVFLWKCLQNTALMFYRYCWILVHICLRLHHLCLTDTLHFLKIIPNKTTLSIIINCGGILLF